MANRLPIIDCVMYHNDKLTFPMRYELLKPYVDKFIVVEASKTHSGTPKTTTFRDDFPDVDVDYYICDLQETSRWGRENEHRRYITNCLGNWNGFVMVSDCDEIPDMTSWGGAEGVFHQRHSYYTPYHVDPRPWRGSVIVHSSRFYSPYGKIDTQDCRNFRDILQRVGYGWHFGWLGDDNWGKQKIHDFAHGELEGTDFISKYHQKLHPGDAVQLIHSTEYVPEVTNRIWKEYCDQRGI